MLNVKTANYKSFTLMELVFVMLVLFLLILFLLPSFLHQPIRANKQKCANNLRGHGIAMILYSSDHKYFPHMKDLDKDHSSDDKDAEATRVYRTLFALKLIDYNEAYVCPSSEDFFIDLPPEVVNDPSLFSFTAKANEASGNGKQPILQKAPGDVPVFKNHFLSYTYRVGKLTSANARATDMLAADKGLRDAEPEPGCHSDGFNVLYADASARFTMTTDVSTMKTLQKRLAMGPVQVTTTVK